MYGQFTDCSKNSFSSLTFNKLKEVPQAMLIHPLIHPLFFFARLDFPMKFPSVYYLGPNQKKSENWSSQIFSQDTTMYETNGVLGGRENQNKEWKHYPDMVKA